MDASAGENSAEEEENLFHMKELVVNYFHEITSEAGFLARRFLRGVPE